MNRIKSYWYQIVLLVRSLLSLAFLFLGYRAHSQQDSPPSREEMWKIIQQQQEELEIFGEMLEQVADQPGGKGLSWVDKTSLGGYGELHYNNLTDQAGSSDRKQIDFHRFVVYIGHEFNERIRFFAEAELEHALTSGDDDSPGEVELEQAFIDIDVFEDEQSLTFRSGLFLIPVGILNETHEPPTFYGVERNNVESAVIPSTWWEAGFSVFGDIIPGLRYDLAFTSGLNVNEEYRIRGGRQKVAEAIATDPAYTARLKWSVPGLEIAGTFQYQSDLTQNADSAPERSEATLFETHAVIQKGPFGLRALYARWDLDADAAELADGRSTPDVTMGGGGADVQHGWFIEPSVKLGDYFGVFARYSEWDNGAGDSTNSRTSQVDFGINWWPHDQVVFKIDYQDQEAPGGQTERDGFNIGVGYNF